ncbi:hypothetical protein N752_19680 [Desulforamulus aquiferis]|nr:hypothetical protein [Desulforamulus aquiferis]RYD03401.1 hypothetical protein N752_19680 [Desulforamulus aquiferis]
MVHQVALVAGREHQDIADLVVESARLIGRNKLLDPNFKLADTVVSEEGASNQVFMGVILNKETINKQMPRNLDDVKILVIDDALEPEEIEDEPLARKRALHVIWNSRVNSEPMCKG